MMIKEKVLGKGVHLHSWPVNGSGPLSIRKHYLPTCLYLCGLAALDFQRS